MFVMSATSPPNCKRCQKTHVVNRSGGKIADKIYKIPDNKPVICFCNGYQQVSPPYLYNFQLLKTLEEK